MHLWYFCKSPFKTGTSCGLSAYATLALTSNEHIVSFGTKDHPIFHDPSLLITNSVSPALQKTPRLSSTCIVPSCACYDARRPLRKRENEQAVLA